MLTSVQPPGLMTVNLVCITHGALPKEMIPESPVRDAFSQT